MLKNINMVAKLNFMFFVLIACGIATAELIYSFDKVLSYVIFFASITALPFFMISFGETFLENRNLLKPPAKKFEGNQFARWFFIPLAIFMTIGSWFVGNFLPYTKAFSIYMFLPQFVFITMHRTFIGYLFSSEHWLPFDWTFGGRATNAPNVIHRTSSYRVTSEYISPSSPSSSMYIANQARQNADALIRQSRR